VFKQLKLHGQFVTMQRYNRLCSSETNKMQRYTMVFITINALHVSICVAGNWRRTNEEVKQLYGELDIVTEIKKGRLRWLGHVARMSDERVVKRLYQNIPEGSRNVGRPRLRWMDDVRET
jgi:hypothetical protein